MKSTRLRPKDKFKTAFKASNQVEDRDQTCGRCGGTVNHIKEMNAQPKIPFVTTAKERGSGRNVAKQKLCQKYRVIILIKFFFGEIHIDQLDSVNQRPWKADI